MATRQDLSILPDNRPALKGDHCLNCGTPLEPKENFCHYCGQRNDQRRLNFWDVLSESIKSYFSVDNRVIHSLIPLVTKPGTLTREYISGKRQQFVHPIRMYLTVSIVYFTLLSLSTFLGRPDLNIINVQETGGPTIEMDESGQNFIIEPREDETEEELPPPALVDSILRIDSTAAFLADSIGAVDEWDEAVAGALVGAELEEFISDQSKWDTVPNDGPYKRPKGYYLEEEESIGRISRFINDQDSIDVVVALEYLKIENTRWNRFTYVEIQKGRTVDWMDVLRFFVRKLPIILFIFLPIFALSFWVVYIRRDYYYIEHLIFLFHVNTVGFLIFILDWLIGFSFPKVDPDGPLILAFMVYSFLSMKRFYGQGWFKTIVKYVLVNIGFFTFGVAFFLLAFGIVFLAY